jgi:hypothetical protein
MCWQKVYILYKQNRQGFADVKQSAKANPFQLKSKSFWVQSYKTFTLVNIGWSKVS